MPTAAELLAGLNSDVQNMDDMAMRMKILLYGQSGVGKTKEAFELAQQTLEPGKRILYIDTGEGWVSLQNHVELKKNVTRLTYKGLSQIEVLVNAIKAGVEGWNDYGAIIFDEFSTSPKQYLHTVLKANNVDPLTGAPEYKHWGILSRNIEGTYWKLMELKESHNLFLIAHERVKEQKGTKIEFIAPSFMDSIEGTVKENVHVVARMTAEVINTSGAPQYSRKMQVHPTRLVVAKSRVGGLDIQVTPERFNERIAQWLATGGVLESEKEVTVLENEKNLDIRMADQDVTFTGFEAKED